MEKTKKYIPKIILLDTIIYVFLIVALYFILSFFKLMFREWIYIVSVIIIMIGFIVGTIQLLLKIKKKVVKSILIGAFIILLLLSIPIVHIATSFSYTPEHVVEKDGKKYVAYVTEFKRTYVYYYDYKNIFVVGKQKRIEEYYGYGKGGFDPIENKYGYEYNVESTIYYDENGKIITIDGQKIEDENGKIITIDGQKIEKENFVKNITNNLKEYCYLSGIITEINPEYIIFERESNNEKYSIEINTDFKYINGRTNEEININDLKVGYYIDLLYGNEKSISILSNIKGEELEKELMINMSLENPSYITVSPYGTNLEIINKDKAILTVTFSDLIGDYNADGGKFEKKVEINSNTLIDRNGESKKIDNLEQIKNVTLDVIKLRLDKNTIYNEIPIATWFMSSNGN